MKRIAMAAVLLAGACIASGAEKVRFYDTDGSDSTDGFTADLLSNGYNNPVGDYTTFCVEVFETFSYGTEYEYQISTEVKDNGGFETRALDSTAGRRVAYLYSKFAAGGAAAIRALHGDFAGYTNAQTRILMQRYIWDRFAYPDSDNWASGTLYSDADFDTLTTAADADGAQTGLHGVRIMNVYAVGHAGDESFGGQDQLTVIPLPSGAGLACAGLLGVVAARRRRA
jgi:hypothetical protein